MPIEIRAFKQAYGSANIFALILAGDPGAGDGPDQCFPPELRFDLDPNGTPDRMKPRQPLAADVREQGDGWHFAVLKLVAGMTGIPLRELERRDARARLRRIRQLQAATLAFALLALFAATVAVLAWRSERKALAQARLVESRTPVLANLETISLSLLARLDATREPLEKILANGSSQLAPGNIACLEANKVLTEIHDALHEQAGRYAELAQTLSGQWGELISIRERRGVLTNRVPALEQLATHASTLLQRLDEAAQRASPDDFAARLDELKDRTKACLVTVDTARARLQNEDGVPGVNQIGLFTKRLDELRAVFERLQAACTKHTLTLATRQMEWSRAVTSWKEEIRLGDAAINARQGSKKEWENVLEKWHSFQAGYEQSASKRGMTERFFSALVDRFEPPPTPTPPTPLVFASALPSSGPPHAWIVGVSAEDIPGMEPIANGKPFPDLASTGFGDPVRGSLSKEAEQWLVEARFKVEDLENAITTEAQPIDEWMARCDAWQAETTKQNDALDRVTASLESLGVKPRLAEDRLDDIQGALDFVLQQTTEARRYSIQAVTLATDLDRATTEFRTVIESWVQTRPEH